jgi:1,4-alpha-glucan branching enzyme
MELGSKITQPALLGGIGQRNGCRDGEPSAIPQDLIRLRWDQPALRCDSVNPFHVHNQNRVIAFHRWLEGEGRDVVVVATLAETTWCNYNIGFPGGGFWSEVFNSDVYDHWVNPMVAGNGGGITPSGRPMHGLPVSAGIVIPANGFVVFARS